MGGELVGCSKHGPRMICPKFFVLRNYSSVAELSGVALKGPIHSHKQLLPSLFAFCIEMSSHTVHNVLTTLWREVSNWGSPSARVGDRVYEVRLMFIDSQARHISPSPLRLPVHA